jgi:glycosyltransferase involved in cell wall biosynthesis
MRILFDGYWWSGGPPSGRNVLTSIVRGWSAAFPDDTVTLALPGQRTGVRPIEVPPTVSLVRSHIPQQGLSAAFELGMKRRFDVVLTQNFTPLMSSALRVTFVHDVMFQEHPEWFTALERRYFAAIPVLASRADLVITSSEAEGSRIARLNPRLRTRTRAVGLALAQAFSTASPEPPALRLKPRGYLLAVGRLNVRKNLERLVEALVSREVIRPEFPLVVVGTEDGFTGAMPHLAQSSRSGAVVRTGFASDGELRWLYANCAAFAFPSLDEGFGLPVLEAAHSGAPMALSAIPAFQEFGAVGSFFDPYDPESIAAAVTESMSRGATADADGLAARYSWSATVQRIREGILEKV